MQAYRKGGRGKDVGGGGGAKKAVVVVVIFENGAKALFFLNSLFIRVRFCKSLIQRAH
jgi:hypothetical protein